MNGKKKERAPIALVILDGFGYRAESDNNAIALAHTPNIQSWLSHYPHTLLQASGRAVGLPDGYMGNSEVGHMTIGCGRIINQPITQINQAIDSGLFFENHIVLEALDTIKKRGGRLHIMGLLSDAGVHAHEKHLYAYMQAAKNSGIQEIIIHVFLDGRDTAPRSAQIHLERLDTKIQEIGIGSLGSVHGRFYAMDRDSNWGRIEKSYRCLTEFLEQEIQFTDWQALLDYYYQQNITDEFIIPTQMPGFKPVGDNDGIIFINIRPDRARQLTAAFVDPDCDHFERELINLSCCVTPISYSPDLDTTVLLPKNNVTQCLMQELDAADVSLFTIAETEKYAHVTYFFNGGHEKSWPNERRILIPSLRRKTYAQSPQMSAANITEYIIESLQTNPRNFYLINYANADMVGHSGNLQATVQAIEFLDEQLKKLYDEIVIVHGGTLCITADHGKAESMVDDNNNQACTAHTTHPVPFIMIQKDLYDISYPLPLVGLSDIAPFILRMYGIKVPKQME